MQSHDVFQVPSRVLLDLRESMGSKVLACFELCPPTQVVAVVQCCVVFGSILLDQPLCVPRAATVWAGRHGALDAAARLLDDCRDRGVHFGVWCVALCVLFPLVPRAAAGVQPRGAGSRESDVTTSGSISILCLPISKQKSEKNGNVTSPHGKIRRAQDQCMIAAEATVETPTKALVPAIIVFS